MSIANEISKLQTNLKDCFDTCADSGAYLPEDINFDNLAACIETIKNPFNKPSDWADIRTDCPDNSIALYAGHTSIPELYTIEDGRLISANSDIYLQSSGTQYIDTGITMNSSYTYNTTVGITQITGDTIVFGRSQGSTGNLYLNQVRPSMYKYINGVQTMLHNDLVVGDKKTYSLTGDYTDDSDKSFFLFGRRNSSDTVDYRWSGKIYSFSITSNNETIYNLVPVPAGLVIGDFTCPSNGMFDIVNQQFYGNSGTGDFVFGVDNISYDNLGFTATCTGGYNVFIDGTQYGATYASGTQCNITWSSLVLDTGDDVTTPSALKAHKIWIEPATSGNNITEFRCRRVAASGTEEQGILWAHFNITNKISLSNLFSVEGTNYRNSLVEAVTAKNNLITVSNLYAAFYNCYVLEYLPVLFSDDNSTQVYRTFCNCYILKTITANVNFADVPTNCFNNCYVLEKIKGTNTFKPAHDLFKNVYALEELPNLDFSKAGSDLGLFIVNAESLKDTVLDVSAATMLTRIGCYGSASHFMGGFKGLRVSSSAPFSGTSPQINVSYTGMDRENLIRLFNDLPTVSDGQIINITGCTGTADLTADDKAIAEDKGWALTLAA